jgi:ADP-ribose pyrophosphatase
MPQLDWPSFSTADVDVLEHETAYQGYFRIDRYRIRHRLFAGGWSQAFMREIFERGTAVGVLLFDPVLNKIVLIEQFRIGAFLKSKSPWLFELVAGIAKPGESFEEVARRETVEEAGVEVLDLVPIYSFMTTPGACSERISLFCARVDASQASGIHGLAEEHEDIRVHVLDPDVVYAALQAGIIDNGIAIVALQWLQLQGNALRARWLNKDGQK